MVEIFYEEIEPLNINQKNIEAWLNELCVGFEREMGDITLIFCSDEYLLEMNRIHLDHDYYTDIITFDYCEGNLVSGDLFISIDRVRENAEKEGELFHVEQLRVVAHGILHLLGFKDKSDADVVEMRNQEGLALRLYVSRETSDR